MRIFARDWQPSSEGWRARGVGIVVLDRAGAAEFASEEATRVLGLKAQAGELPAELREWLASLLERGPGTRPSARLVLDSTEGGQAAIHHLPARRPCDSEALLVERATDLLALELTVSRRTVDKHLQNIYQLLGASSRTQAVLTAWSIARPARSGLNRTSLASGGKVAHFYALSTLAGCERVRTPLKSGHVRAE